MTNGKNLIQDSRIIIIKIGSSTLVEPKSNIFRFDWLNSLVYDIAQLIQQGKSVIIVTSASVALGRAALQLSEQNLTLNQKQAAAAVGMGQLIHLYGESFKKYHIPVGQILLTLEDSEDRKRYLNARHTISTLLSLGAVPIINENDSIATSEIKVGDNDRLSARVAAMVSADLLIMLSDIDGLYTANPHKDTTAKHISFVNEITPKIIAMAGCTASNLGTGGMETKLAAAKICMEAGVKMLLLNGHKNAPLSRLLEGERSTLFASSLSAKSARKTWLATSLKPVGKIIINKGACQALAKGKSLLPIGISSISGDFRKGDAVTLYNEENIEIGCGLSNFPSFEGEMIRGLHSSEIEEILGYKPTDEFIHRDNLVLFNQ